MTISTKTGDKGKTGLVGGGRLSKADARVAAYGTLDELCSTMGFARSICKHEAVCEATKAIQKELFTVSAALATAGEVKEANRVTCEMVEGLTKQVHEIESIDGLLGDWALPGEHTASAAFDVARTVCRRAERAVVHLADSGEAVDGLIVAYVNRLSDLLWLFGRLVEKEAGINAKLRDGDRGGGNWSRAW